VLLDDGDRIQSLKRVFKKKQDGFYKIDKTMVMSRNIILVAIYHLHKLLDHDFIWVGCTWLLLVLFVKSHKKKLCLKTINRQAENLLDLCNRSASARETEEWCLLGCDTVRLDRAHHLRGLCPPLS
jgi:hypothetical protein